MNEHAKLVNRCPKKLNPRRFDLFGQTVNFTIGQDDSYKTVCGFIFTLIFYALVIAALIYYGSQLVREDQPNLQYSKIKTPEFFNEDLGQQHYDLILLFRNGGSYFPYSKVNSLFNVELSTFKNIESVNLQTGGITKMAQNVRKLEPVPCKAVLSATEHSFAQEIPKSQKQLYDSFGICFDFTQNVTLSGGLGENQNLMKLLVSPCSGRVECKSTADIKKVANWTQVLYQQIQGNVDIENKDSPIGRTVNSDTFVQFEPDKLKKMTINLKKLEVDSDHGIIFPINKKLSAIAYSERHLDSRIRYDDTEPFLETFFKPTNDLELYQRSYLTIMDVLGSIGGLTEVIIFFILLFYTTYNSFFLQKRLFRKGLFMLNQKDLKQSKDFQSTFKAKYSEGTIISCCFSKKKYLRSNLALQAGEQLVDDSLTIEKYLLKMQQLEALTDIFLQDYQKKALGIALFSEQLKQKIEEADQDEKEQVKKKFVQWGSVDLDKEKEELNLSKGEEEIGLQDSIDKVLSGAKINDKQGQSTQSSKGDLPLNQQGKERNSCQCQDSAMQIEREVNKYIMRKLNFEALQIFGINANLQGKNAEIDEQADNSFINQEDHAGGPSSSKDKQMPEVRMIQMNSSRKSNEKGYSVSQRIKNVSSQIVD